MYMYNIWCSDIMTLCNIIKIYIIIVVIVAVVVIDDYNTLPN